MNQEMQDRNQRILFQVSKQKDIDDKHAEGEKFKLNPKSAFEVLADNIDLLYSKEHLISQRYHNFKPSDVLEAFYQSLYGYKQSKREMKLNRLQDIIKQHQGHKPRKKILREECQDFLEELKISTSDEESELSQDRPELADLYSMDRIEKAERLLEEEHVLKKVKTVLDHKIAGEDLNKLGVFLQLLSKDTEKPLMIFGVQKQGEGKSYIAKNVMKLFPDWQVKDVTDMTKAALYRRAEEDPTYFDGKIVFFGEIPENEDDREIFQIFRQLVSEGKVSKELVIEKNGELTPVELKLEGSPVVASTTVNPGIIDAQDMSRGMAYSPEMSKEQNEKVRSFQNREREFPNHVLNPSEIEDLEETITCALDIISRETPDIQNPFARDMDSEIPSDSDNIKRDYPKALKISSEMPAYLYHRQRPKRSFKGDEYTFVTWKDVARGIVINRKFINNMIRGRTESAMDAYKEVKDNVEAVDKSWKGMEDYITEKEISEEESFTNQDLQKWMGLNSKTAAGYTRKLNRMELIFKDSSGRPHKHYLVDDDKSETAGITLRSLYDILASVFSRDELGEWARKYLRFSGLEENRESILGDIAFSETDLPIKLDLGTELDDTLPIPLYMKISGYKSKVATDLKIEKKGANISIRFGSVNEEFKPDTSDDSSEPSQNIDQENTIEESEKEKNKGVTEEFGDLRDKNHNEETSVIYKSKPELGEDISEESAKRILKIFRDHGPMKTHEARMEADSPIDDLTNKVNTLEDLELLDQDKTTYLYSMTSKGKGLIENQGLNQIVE